MLFNFEFLFRQQFLVRRINQVVQHFPFRPAGYANEPGKFLVSEFCKALGYVAGRGTCRIT